METHVFHIRKLFFVVLTTTPYACHAFQHVSTNATENGGANRGSESEGTPDFSLPVRVTPRIVLEIANCPASRGFKILE